MEKQNLASSEDKTYSYIPDCSDLPYQKMQIMYIYVRIIQFMEQNIKKLPNTKGKIIGCRCIFLLLIRAC